MGIVTALVSIITNAPQLISEATILYNAVRAPCPLRIRPR
jgi:hypothetical protein